MTPTRWAILALIAAILWFFAAVSAILLPFVVGFAVAYLLDPVADRLEAVKVPRSIAAFVALSAFVLLFALFAALLLPVFVDQSGEVVRQLTVAIHQLKPMLLDLAARFDLGTGATATGEDGDIVSQGTKALMARGGEIAQSVLMQGMALFNLVALMLVSPIVAYYLLVDWDHMIARANDLLPRQHADLIRRHAREIDAALSGFVRGQTMVCIAFAICFSIGWSIAGLDHAILLGCLAGLLGYIPIAGKFTATILAMLMGFGQWGLDAGKLGAVALVYVIVLALDNMLFTPRFVGNAVGLHPVWVLFAIFAGGAIMGPLGVLLAVPLAAVISVLVRSAMEHYLQSRHFDPEQADA